MPNGVDLREEPLQSGQLELPFEPVPERGVSFLRHGARRFAERNGRTYSSQGMGQIQAQPQLQAQIARRYEHMPVYAGDHRSIQAYQAFRDETDEQYRYLTTPRSQGGLGVKHEITSEDPYSSPEEMMEDVHVNRRLKTFASATTGGAPHDLLDEETNDKFRAVHDAFGHAASGRSFSRHGEEAAYHSHAQMYSPGARRALLAETRAQASYLVYGPTGNFVEQARPVMLPDWATGSPHPATKR